MPSAPTRSSGKSKGGGLLSNILHRFQERKSTSSPEKTKPDSKSVYRMDEFDELRREIAARHEAAEKRRFLLESRDSMQDTEPFEPIEPRTSARYAGGQPESLRTQRDDGCASSAPEPSSMPEAFGFSGGDEDACVFPENMSTLFEDFDDGASVDASDDGSDERPHPVRAPAPSICDTLSPLPDTVPQELSWRPEPLVTTDVQFTVLAPQAVKAGESFLLDVMMYEEKYRKQVEETINRAVQEMAAQESGFYGVGLKQKVQVELVSEDISFHETSRAVTWNGKLAKFTFMPSVPGAYAKPQIRMTATVYIDGIALLDLMLLLRLSRQPQEIIPERGKPRSLFVCYAREDTEEVHKRLQGILAIAPDTDIFMDRRSIRNGEFWRERIRQAILKQDQLFLFWSHSASASEYVDEEWRFALEHKGLTAIVPMPLVSPEVCPPPAELNEINFGDWTVHYANANRYAAVSGAGSIYHLHR